MAEAQTKNVNTENVTTGKPKVTGAVFMAPIGTALPQDATSELDKAFLSLGYVSKDGLTNAESFENSSVQAWGGDTVLNSLTAKPDDFKLTLIETLNKAVQALRYGDKNVAGDLATGITIKSVAEQPVNHSFVVDMILRGNVLKRIVIPSAAITSVEDIKYVDADVTGYGLTLSAEPDEHGVTHYEYLKKGGAEPTKE